jgi:alpha-mannosidase
MSSQKFHSGLVAASAAKIMLDVPMKRNLACSLLAAVLALLEVATAHTMKAPDIASKPTLYVVPYAHLDTQWRWEFPQRISEFLLKTMRVNFEYIDRYPHYVFNWTGANRYRLMKEYFPDDYARMKQYIAAGRWYPAGSSMEEGDVTCRAPSSSFARCSTAIGGSAELKTPRHPRKESFPAAHR